MAGMLPGVGVPSRRRSMHLSERQSDPRIHRHPSLGQCPLESSATTAASSTMDETAFRARQRLEQKLGCFRHSSSRSSSPAEQGRGCHHTAHAKDARSGSKRLGRPWPFQRNIRKAERQVCAVCLEEFQAEQDVMGLSCSHKYHSNCLLPWLAKHPHCPCCRSPVKS
ncbi:probable E3 ubiquitin-protein ligase XERICO [Malania oleifera]|uniref:probable E3 ubiquitin-protein ligase XERICO n=1 Tax=Malania oleifera TaxID=397392 RepID=UPI0025AE4D6D|nr:probable E3 ubiquitin-protein ligase XERICO [Malania oleifera]